MKRNYEELSFSIDGKCIQIPIQSEISTKIKENAEYERALDLDRWVPDVCRYRVKLNSKRYSVEKFNLDEKEVIKSNFNDMNSFHLSKLKSIVILLESPHKDEFDINGLPKGPAQGVTGFLIEKFISEVINNRIISHLCDNEYRVVIINPLPMQTSLYNLHKNELKGKYTTLRNNVWKTIWNYSAVFRNSLDKRIELVSPAIVLNCCTAKLKGIINLKSMNEDIKIISLYHPSNWNRQIEKVG